MRRLALFLAVLAFAGCDRTDPYLRDGVWRPAGANEANLRAMVEVPADLVAARRSSQADGALAAAAVDRLRHDHVRPLLDSGLAHVVPVAGGSGAQQPVGAPSGSGN